MSTVIDKDNMIQSVVITFSDGEQAFFTGKAVVFEGDNKTISNISFTLPKDMPKDCSWGKI